MRTRNETLVRAPLASCLHAAADVERWPHILPHYRAVRFVRWDHFGIGLVRMEAVRRFGVLPWPIWWVSEMRLDTAASAVLYRHVQGVTRGMEVAWHLREVPGGTRISIVHVWSGPSWPFVSSLAARGVIGPQFIHVVADRTLAGIKRALEAGDA